MNIINASKWLANGVFVLTLTEDVYFQSKKGQWFQGIFRVLISLN